MLVSARKKGDAWKSPVTKTYPAPWKIDRRWPNWCGRSGSLVGILDRNCEGILEGWLRWHHGRTDSLMVTVKASWTARGRLRWHRGWRLGRHLGWTAFWRVLAWRVLVMASWTVTAKATANASLRRHHGRPLGVPKSLLRDAIAFGHVVEKSDFLPSPKNESSHSSETVISTSLT